MRLADLQQLAPQLHELLVDLPPGASLFNRAELTADLEDLLHSRIAMH